MYKTFETEDIYVPTDGESFVYAFVRTPSLEVPEKTREDYPALSDALELWSDERGEASLEHLAKNWELAEEMVAEDYAFIFNPNYEDCDMTVVRADDKAVSVLFTTESFANGIHPTTQYDSFFLDTQSGEFLPLSDAVADMFALPEAIWENLEDVGGQYDFTDDRETVFPLIEEYVAEGAFAWTMDDVGFHAYFGPYDLMYYAFGPIHADVAYADYPELFNPECLPMGNGTPLSDRITYKEDDTIICSAEELAPFASGGFVQDREEQSFLIECPEWDATCLADGIFDELTESLVTLTEEDEESSDWLDQTKWSEQNGIALPETAYASGGTFTDERYRYNTDNTVSDSLRLEVYDRTNDMKIGAYDFSEYRNTPTSGNAYTTLEIPFAKLLDGILYVEIAHRTYSEDQPCTGFLVAVESDTGRLLWRSDMLVANAHNFVLDGDFLICGYGFTAEDDYLYILSRISGAVLKKQKLKSAPDYFIPDYDNPDGRRLYVLTYNTAYTYAVSYG